MMRKIRTISVWALGFLVSGAMVSAPVWAWPQGSGNFVLAQSGDHHKGDHHRYVFFGGGGFLGVQLSDLTPELRTHFGAPEDLGVMVSKVVPDSPAERAGVQVGDIITAVDGEEIASGWELAHEIRSRAEGDEVDFEIWRDGRVENLTAAVEQRQQHRWHRKVRSFRIRCDDDQEDCDFHLGHDFDFRFLCGEEDDCDIRVECEDGECTCLVDGEETDCESLGVPTERG